MSSLKNTKKSTHKTPNKIASNAHKVVCKTENGLNTNFKKHPYTNSVCGSQT